MQKQNNTIVYFHIGRGGKYHNSGFKSFVGEHDLSHVIAKCDAGKQNTYINKEHHYEWAAKLKKRDLTNLFDLLQQDEAAFEKRTGISLGEEWYFNNSGDAVISVEEVEGGVGTLNWDNEYDTDVCKYLADCDEEELLLIEEDYGGYRLIQEYFNECTVLKIDWAIFNEDYKGLIEEYFAFPNVDVENYYTEYFN